MKGDKLIYYPNFEKTTNEIISSLTQYFLDDKRLCIAIGGESGSGKTSLAYALLLNIQKALNVKGYIFHADDYFFLPPLDNHNRRLKNIANVGVKEVNLNALDENLRAFIKHQESLTKPLVYYKENRIKKETIFPNDYQFCIVEGTYTMLLKEPDYKVFIENSFQHTKANREKRARDIMNEFNEQVLRIEHNIIKHHYKYADKTLRNISIDS